MPYLDTILYWKCLNKFICIVVLLVRDTSPHQVNVCSINTDPQPPTSSLLMLTPHLMFYKSPQQLNAPEVLIPINILFLNSPPYSISYNSIQQVVSRCYNNIYAGTSSLSGELHYQLIIRIQTYLSPHHSNYSPPRSGWNTLQHLNCCN